jgi:hypothetical protein
VGNHAKYKHLELYKKPVASVTLLTWSMLTRMICCCLMTVTLVFSCQWPY